MNRLLFALALLLAPGLALAQPVVAPTYQAQDGQTKEALGTFCVGSTCTGGGGGGGGGAVTAASGAYALGSIVDMGTGASPGANTLNGRLSSIFTKMPALGTAGASSADVISIQGIAGGTPQPIGGVVAGGTTAAGNPVPMGCIYNTALPTYTNGQRGEVQCSSKGSAYVGIAGTTGTHAQVTNTFTDATATASGLYTNSQGLVFNGTTWDRARGDTNGASIITAATASAANGISPSVGSLVSNVAAKTAAGNLYSVSITTATTGGPFYLYVFNSTTLPSDGAVTAGTASGNYQVCSIVAASTTYTASFDVPEVFSVGIRPVVSTSACGTLTATASAVFLKARVK